MADNKVPLLTSKEMEMQIIPYDHKGKAIVPVNDPEPIETIPPYASQSFFAQPRSNALIKLPAGTKLFPPRPNETLLGVRKDRFGNIRSQKYIAGSRLAIEGVRANTGAVKFIPPTEAGQRLPGRPRNRKTVADCVQDIEGFKHTV
jgi:hypothetical protein